MSRSLIYFKGNSLQVLSLLEPKNFSLHAMQVGLSFAIIILVLYPFSLILRGHLETIVV